ncbi:MAG TPA: CehA/McbA family metallohydrolase [Thermoanaerobaculia bacterium]|nr:CehA/McbA family metallohydrolase [Thermoanaerobaculia bacterium]
MRTLLVALAVLAPLASFAADPVPLRWYKGNTHTHTLNSDGDSTPDAVVTWYREHGYQFLVLSDHNYLTPIEGLAAIHAADEKFLLIRGEEVTDLFEKEPIHVNGLDLEKLVPPQGGASVRETIQRDVDAIVEAGGVPHVNHPNFSWAITAADLAKIERMRLFEIYNGHPIVNVFGGGGRPSLEAMWDEILSTGKLLYGIAVDDAHHFKRIGDPEASTPGHGWIVVRAPKLTAAEILGAMQRGDFYASTGVELSDLKIDSASIEIAMRPRVDTLFTTRFIGRGGVVLRETGDNPARYAIRGDEGYVRATVTDSNGRHAWVQPVVVGAK